MEIVKKFKDFTVKGNMLDMAIGIIIGASFNAIVNVLVKNVMLPPFSLLSDGVNFGEKKIILRETNGATQLSIDYGLLIEAVIDFLIVGFTIFIVVKFINKLRNQANNVEDTSVPTPADIELLSKIKDLLEKQNEALIKKKRSLSM